MKTVPLVAIAVVLSSLATAALLTSLGSRGQQAADPDLERRIEALESAPRRPAPIYSPPASRPSPGPALAGAERPDQSEVAAQADAVMKEYENRFRSEPVSPAWAQNTELAVLEALVSDEAEAAGVAMPDNVEVRCRTSLCRISADYADDAAAADAAMILAMDISAHLPRTQRRTVYQPDGSVQMLIFAMQ